MKGGFEKPFDATARRAVLSFFPNKDLQMK
jgi:hypothetical protein